MTRRGWLLFSALAVLWGVPYLFTKIAVAETSPALLAWARVVVGAAVLLPIAWRRGSLRGSRQRLGLLAIYAALELVIPFPLIAWGEQAVSSSLAAIVVSSMPLVVAALAWRFDRAERLGGARMAGLAVGLSGVVLLVGIDVGGRSSVLLGGASIFVATVAYAAAALLVRVKLSEVDPLGAVAVALGIGSVMLAPPALATMPHQLPSAGALLAIVALGVGCTAAALVLDVALIGEVGAGRAAVVTYVNPVIALLLGIGLLQERLTAAAIVGIVLVLAGSWLSTMHGDAVANLAARAAVPGLARLRTSVD